MNGTWLDFEKPIIELERKIEELKSRAGGDERETAEELDRLEKKADRLRKDIFSKLTRWQRVKLARHPRRPYTLDYLKVMAPQFMELHGDRRFADDPAIVGGLGMLDELPVLFLGHQKGRDTKENIHRNFGMANPEGYRKALRLMRMAANFEFPIVTFVDTPGAYPGLGAEERGQSEALARNILEMAHLPVPIVTVVIGEGGSGGALALAVGDVVMMLENSIYSVITPEGCAAILWKDASKAEQAAENLRLTAQDLLELKVVDEVIPEPLGGAHRDPEETARRVKETVQRHLKALIGLPKQELLDRRLEKYLKMGVYLEETTAVGATQEG
ncbi:MAG TPA: acetyl-CoA carboxylase carboxyltransferase subunit alpha [Candidatus Eisenbacteria bacterium]|jgi:acetyl-CoA carboxylase carboxyl transferase subunit alpha|nr:acetyl-CoA carboxylase carboxyltransferase subunit alpha [Candidatus Eisenbacteria bacterium]